MTEGSPTLAQSSMSVPLSMTLSRAIEVGEALRRLHESGSFHGALTPSSIDRTPAGLELLPSTVALADGPTPYTAPELTPDAAPDARSDIYAFGVMLYEMVLGGLPNLADGNPATLTGHTALDQVLANCMAPNPAARWQRMDPALMELRLILAGARREECGGITRQRRAETRVRGELRHLESAITERIQGHEKAFSAAIESVTADQRTVLEIASSAVEQLRAEIAAMNERLTAAVDRVDAAELVFEEIRRESARANHDWSTAIEDLKATVKSQTELIDTARQASSHTDALLERVVETVVSLQDLVLDRSEERIAVRAA